MLVMSTSFLQSCVDVMFLVWGLGRYLLLVGSQGKTYIVLASFMEWFILNPLIIWRGSFEHV